MTVIESTPSIKNISVETTESKKPESQPSQQTKRPSFYSLILLAISQLDSDGDASLSKAEKEKLNRLALELAVHDALENKDQSLINLLAAFAADKNKDGIISLEEIAKLNQISGSTVKIDEAVTTDELSDELSFISAVLATGNPDSKLADANKDGIISYDEIQEIAKQVQAGLLEKSDAGDLGLDPSEILADELGLEFESSEQLIEKFIDFLIGLLEQLKSDAEGENDGEQQDYFNNKFLTNGV